MELLEDPNVKHKYQKCKMRVKLWESDFMDKYGRKPNKNDIKEASTSIKEAYKMYWKLKTQALEETLADITFCEDAQSNISIVSSNDVVTEKVEAKALYKDINKDAENIHPDKLAGECPKESEISVGSTTDISNLEGVWGSHLSKTKEILPKKKSILIGRSSSFQLSQNKFSSTSFSKRNPRKSLSSNKIKSKSDINTNVNPCVSEDLNNSDGFDIAEDTTNILGEPMKVVFTDSSSVAQPLSTIHQLTESQTNATNRKVDQGWLNRCTRKSNIELMTFQTKRLSGMSDSGIESIESSMQSSQGDTHSSSVVDQPQISDEEDFVLNSDSEEERRNKRIRNFKKGFNDQDNYSAKRTCFDIDKQQNMTRSLDLSDEIYNTQAVSVKCNVERGESVKQSESLSTINLLSVPCESNITVNNLSLLQSDSINSGNSRDTTLVDKKSANNVDSADKTPPQPKVATGRKGRRIVKQYSSGDSDTEYSDVDYSEKNKKERPKRTRRAPPKKDKVTIEKNTDNEQSDSNSTEKSKKGISRRTRRAPIKKDDVSIEKVVNKRTTRKAPTAKRKSTRTSKTNKIEEETQDAEVEDTEDVGPPVYGIETLEAVPRFPIMATGAGNLVEEFSKSVSMVNNKSFHDHPAIKHKVSLTDKEKLIKKIETGQLNDNYVRINLKKKVFVRGKKSFNFSKYKKNQWKQKRKGLESSEGSLDVADLADKNGGVLTCFKCGGIGHFSRYCKAMKSDELIPLDQVDDSSDFPTLEEAERMAKENALLAHSTRIDRLPERPAASYSSKETSEDILDEEWNELTEELTEVCESEEEQQTQTPGCHKIPEELLSKLLPPPINVVNPLYNAGINNELIATPSEVFKTLEMFGHKSFRPGQEKAIMRILSGLSTLVTLSTGSGKSLCYQLPAYLYSKHSNCITLVISPLVSLMDDQVTGVPSFLSAAALHTGQAQKVRDNVMEMVRQGKVNILLVSPEAVVAGEKSTGFGALLRQLPPIAFACIDEAHCISQWSHNFRPSYLMICRVLREKLRVNTILGLTATATKATADNIVNYLGIRDGTAGIISDTPMPKNLYLTVSKDELKDQALAQLLHSERFKDISSIIIYCTRREECARIAGFLRVCLQNSQQPGDGKKAKVSNIAEAYHAGLTASRRKVVQKAFMSGQTRIVVATVAFGMGINKADIRSVIHYNMPGTFEGYVQEVGRAGRDGLIAQCHLFLNPKENSDKWELQRHIFANGIDRHVIRRLLQKVFIPCACTKVTNKTEGRRCPGHEVAIPVDETVSALDIPEEMISTLLCYLELHPKRYITVLSSVYINARVTSYAGAQGLKSAAQASPPLAMAIAMDNLKGISHDNSSLIEFPIVEVSSAIGWDSGVAKSHLKNLEWKTVDGKSKRSHISVKFDTLGLRVKAPGDLSDTELDEALEALVSRTQRQEASRLHQLETIHNALNKHSMPSVRQCFELNEEVIDKSESLKNSIRSYFQSDMPQDDCDVKSEIKLNNEAEIAGDVRSLVLSYRDNNFNGRAVARIFHGIQSPNYPALIWSKCRFWRAHLSSNFNGICQIATREILALR